MFSPKILFDNWLESVSYSVQNSDHVQVHVCMSRLICVCVYLRVLYVYHPQVLKSTTAVTAVKATATAGPQMTHAFFLPQCPEAPIQQSQDKADEYGLDRKQ